VIWTCKLPETSRKNNFDLQKPRKSKSYIRQSKPAELNKIEFFDYTYTSHFIHYNTIKMGESLWPQNILRYRVYILIILNVHNETFQAINVSEIFLF
jgi:hypothetical protein